MPVQNIGAQPPASSRVSFAIGNASKRTGFPFDYLMAQARVESSLDPYAQAGASSAAGRASVCPDTSRYSLVFQRGLIARVRANARH